jgi:hypothetical protein
MNPQQEPTNNQQQYPTPNSSQPQPAPTEPPKAKKTGLIVAVIVVVVAILGIGAFVMMNSNKDNSSKTTNNTSGSNANTNDTKFQNYDVTDKVTGIVFSVSFYKGASATEKNGRTFLTSGEEGAQTSVYLGAGKQGKIDCGSAPSTTMRLNSESTTVCYKEDGTQYGGYVTTKGMTVQLNLARQQPVSMDEAKTIMEGVTFK